MKRLFSVIFLLVLPGSTLVAQSPAQIIRGHITDAASGSPLSGATITLLGTPGSTGAISDTTGYYRLEKVPVGRRQLQVSYLGYETVVLSEIPVESGKEVLLDIQLTEKPAALQEVVVKAKGKNAPPHPLSLYTLRVEEQFRYPTTYFDPARLATTLPGVAGTDDQGNHISIRGNSPAAVRWRLEGVDIVNPNHTANAGTFSDRPTAAGGGVNILSAQLLGPSNFLTGAFPAGYGNALGGILDMRLRDGNDQRHEFTGQASVIGFDVAAEGPLRQGNSKVKSSDASYLVNYRYSFVGLLTSLGVDFGGEEINFQDLSFHLHIPFDKGGGIGIFGLGGMSENLFRSPGNEQSIEEDKDRFDIDFSSKMGAVGMTLQRPLGKKTGMRWAVAYSGLEHERTADLVAFVPDPVRWNADEMNENKLAISGRFTHKVNTRNSWDAGMLINRETAGFQTFFTDLSGSRNFGGEVKGWLLQPYLSWKSYLTPTLKLNAGLQSSHFTFSGDHLLLEPRVSVAWTATKNQVFSLAYGLHGQIQPPQVYLARLLPQDGIGRTKSHHLVAAFRQQFSPDLLLKTEVYHQSLYDIPVSARQGSTYSPVNDTESFRVLEDTLTGTGKGRNYGIDIWLEKSMLRNAYVRLGASLYRSLYTAFDGRERPTRFDGRYLLNATTGQERVKQKGDKTIVKGISARIVWYGGFRQTPVDAAASAATGYTVFREEETNEQKLKSYFRVDWRIYWKWNRAGYNTSLSIDIQNLLNRQNEAYRYYDPVQGRVVSKKQLGIIPLLSYRVEF